MLLKHIFVFGLFASVNSVQIKDAAPIDILLTGEPIIIGANYETEFEVCALRNNFNKVVCEVKSGDDYDQCPRDVENLLPGPKFFCQFTVFDVQREGKYFASMK